MELHKGLVVVGFLGGLETDAYDNLKTTLIGEPQGSFAVSPAMVGAGLEG